MIEDGCRLSFSIQKNSFNITDNLSGKILIYNNGNMLAHSLDVNIVLQHISNLQEAVMSYKKRKLLPWQRLTAPASEEGKLIISEGNHYEWALSYNEKGARLENCMFTYSSGFDAKKVLNMVNSVYATLLQTVPSLHPKRDIVRRIIDVGLLVWVQGTNSVAVYEKNVSGNTMTNCLINGRYYPIVIVSTSQEDKITTLFNSQLEEIVTFPLDDSILSFYPPDEEAFD